MKAEPTDKPYVVTWELYSAEARLMAEYLKNRDFTFNGQRLVRIYGIPRGGLVLAVCLSHLTKLPVEMNIEQVGPDCLVVDDIVDTGKTLSSWRSEVFEHPFASMFKRDGSSGTPWLYGRSIPAGWRVIFPYETKESAYE